MALEAAVGSIRRIGSIRSIRSGVMVLAGSPAGGFEAAVEFPVLELQGLLLCVYACEYV